MKTIITIQHTESVHHKNGMVGSRTDWPLTERGMAQARRIGERLKGEVDTSDCRLYTSDLLRARQTAALVGEALGLEPIPRAELRERDLGACCGRSVQWLREHKTCDERTIDDRLFPDAESRREEWARLKPFFDEVMACEADTAIIVSHGDLLSALHMMFIGAPVEALDAAELWGVSGGVSFLRVNGAGKHVIARLSDTRYMSESI